MSKKDVLGKLPSKLQTDVNKKFFDATIDQTMSSAERESINGYIGRREGGSYDPLKDFYVPEPDKDRTWNQLEPLALSEDNSGIGSNEVFIQDLLNYIENNGGEVGNQDRLFSSEKYSFAPPIDVDKFINYSAYLWQTDFYVRDSNGIITGDLSVKISGLDDDTINGVIIGAKNYTAPDGFEFTNGAIITFPDSTSFSELHQIVGVGSDSGIEIMPRYPSDKLGNPRLIVGSKPDYSTLEFGSRNNNEWSVNNFWFHKQTLAEMSAHNGLNVSATATQARRPIISFDKDLELFGYGTEAYQNIEFATVDSPLSIDKRSTGEVIMPNGDVDNNTVALKENDRLIFIGDNNPIAYDTKESFVARNTPYDFAISLPFSEDKTNVFSVVRRNITLPLVYFSLLSSTGNMSFNQSFSESFNVITQSPIPGDPYSVDNQILATKVAEKTYTVDATSIMASANTNFSDERIFVYEVFDSKGAIPKDLYTVSKTINGEITITLDDAPNTYVKVELHVILGTNDIINPDWFELSPDTNEITYRVDVPDNVEEELVMAQQSNPLIYTADMTVITEPEYIRVYANDVLIDETQYDWSSNANTQKVTVSFLNVINGNIVAKVADGIKGLIDGSTVQEGNRDIVDVYVDAEIELIEHAMDGSLSYSISTGIEGIEEENVASIKITDSNKENVDSNNTIVDSVSYAGDTVNITLKSLPNDITDVIQVYVRRELDIVTYPSDYIWEATKRLTNNLPVIPNYDEQWVLMPYEDISDKAVHGDTALVINAGAPYHEKSFYFNSIEWLRELDSGNDTNYRGKPNTFPKFQLYYTELTENGDPISLSNTTYFPQSTFAGSEIFSYKLDPTTGIIDPYLDKQLSYRSISQSSELVFEHDLETDEYTYFDEGMAITIGGYHYFRKTNNNREVEFDYTWARSEEPTKLRVIDRAVYVDDRYSLVENTHINGIYELRVPLSVRPIQTGASQYDVLGFLQGVALGQGREIVSSDLIADVTWDFFYDNSSMEIVYYVKNNSVENYDVFEFKTYSHDLLKETDAGYFEIPSQLEDNPRNDEIEEVTMSDLIPHFSSIISNQDGFNGTALGSRNNYRDTVKDVGLGDRIIQTSAPLIKAMLSTTEDYLDIPKALEFSSEEYTRYKDKIISTSRQMMKEGWVPTAVFDSITLAEQQFDEVITRVYNSLDYNGAFVGGNMLPWGTSFVSEIFKVNSTFKHDVTATSSLTSEGTMSLLYKVDNINTVNETAELLIIGDDYDIIDNTLTVLKPNFIGNDLRLKVYENIDSAKVPSTPSKCGMYQTYRPEMKLDTTYANPTWVIIGHDGSKTPCYTSHENICVSRTGEESIDLRDKMLLEFETRIYNNINVEYLDVYDKLINKYQYISGYARDAKYTSDELNRSIIREFLEWNYHTDSNYRVNDTFDIADWKTWNYSSANPDMAGNWKGIYVDLYDTISPNTTPWEMLGFTTKPMWWDGEYGSPSNVIYNFDCDPYVTANVENTVVTAYSSADTKMWRDISNGEVVSGERVGIYEEFKRPHMTGNGGLILPVDNAGNLLAPHMIGLGIYEPSDVEKAMEWKFGDLAPVEYSWYKSSNYVYSLISKIFLMSPNLFCEFWWDRSKVVQAPISPNQIVDNPEYKRRSNESLEVHNENGTPKCGYQRFVYDRMMFIGRDATSDFADIIRGSKVKLGHRVAGYTNSETLKILLEGSAYDSTNTNLVVPTENYEVKIHTGEVVEQHRYSGVMIRISENGYQVMGYDRSVPEFRFYGRKASSKSRQINVGGKPSAFRNFTNGGTYSAGAYVKYNNKFYQSTTDQIVNMFEEGSWTKLADIPTTGGLEVSYVKDYDVDAEYIVDYNTVFPDVQSLFDFIVGYGDWLTADGWDFSNVDNSTGKVQDWLQVGEDILFWLNNDWSVGNTLQVSAGSEKLNLKVSKGYPNDIRSSNGEAGNILAVNGVQYDMGNVFVSREQQEISVASTANNSGIYFLTVNSDETEHIIVFDNTTEFNDRIYDPLLGIRVERLGIRGYRTENWFGKYEADGYLITGDSIKPNFDNIVDSARYYYDPSKILDNQNIEDAARHLIGFENRDYLTRLRMFDDIQYQLYKGMLPEKGTYRPLDAISRAESVSGTGDVNVYEMWAFKMGELGDVLNSRSLELSIHGDQTKANPQMVKLDYPSKPAGTGEIRRIHLIDCEHVYRGEPVVKVWDGKTKKASVDGNGMSFDFRVFDDSVVAVELDDDRRISSVVITEHPQIPYTEAPVLAFYDISDSEDYFVNASTDGLGFSAYDMVDHSHVETGDKGIALISNRITPLEGNDDAITIDIDDSDKWLSANKVQGNDKLLPYVNKVDGSVTKTCGYVHFDDVDMTSYLLSDIKDSIRVYDNDLENKVLWVAELQNTHPTKDWTVYTLMDDSITHNAIKGSMVVDNQFYEYEPSSAASLTEILNVIDVEGNVLSNGVSITPSPYDREKFDVWPIESNSKMNDDGSVELDLGSSTRNLTSCYISADAQAQGFSGSRTKMTINISQMTAAEFLPSGKYDGWKEDPELVMQVIQYFDDGRPSIVTNSEVFVAAGENQSYVFETDIAPEANTVMHTIVPTLSDKNQKTVFFLNSFDVVEVEITGSNPDGSIVSEEVIYDIDLSTTKNLFFMDSRFHDHDDFFDEYGQRQDKAMGMIWDDDINGRGWAVRKPYINASGGLSTSHHRIEQQYINSDLVKTMSVYDGATNSTLAKIPTYDPYKGIIPTLADRNLTYINDEDPSRYTHGASEDMINSTLSFSKDNVGELWWDTSSAKYALYEQGTDKYRLDNWGKLFPDSKVDVYEWVESSVMPSEYYGNGQPKDTVNYVVRDVYEYKTETYIQKFYFWVKDKTDRPSNLANRTISAKNVANLIANPRVQGYQWFAFISQSSFIFNNINEAMSQSENIFQINYNKTESENSKHIEWKLLAEGKPDEVVPLSLWNKMIDSVSKYDTNGNIVPSPILSNYNKLGIDDAPRQTMFDDVFEARRIMVQSINELLSDIRIRDDLNWIGGGMIKESVHWSWTDWYADGFDANSTVPNLVVNYDQVGGRVIPPPPSIDSNQDKILADGDIIQQYVADNSAYYVYDKESMTATTLVRRQDTSLKMNDTTYQKIISSELDLNIRYFLELVGNEVFIDGSIGEYADNKADFFFSMVKYAAHEQRNVDWFFKTTYIDVVQENKQLLSQPKFYDADDLDGYLDFITEVKPYQTKVREFSTKYDNFIDGARMIANDFDSLSYTTTPITFDNQGNITGGGETIPVIDPKFDPFEVVRSIQTTSVYDSVQCSFTNKYMRVETGGQEKIVGENTDVITFGVTPFHFDVLVNNEPVADSEYTSSTNEGGVLSIAFNNSLNESDYVFIREYLVSDGTTTEYTLKTMPQIDKISYSISSTGVLGDDMEVTTTLVNGQDFTPSNHDTILHWTEVTIDSDALPPAGTKMYPYGAISFTHTDVEEMRLSYHGHDTQIDTLDGNNEILDFKLVHYNLLSDVNGDPRSGWGYSDWKSFDWGSKALAAIPPTLQAESSGWNASGTQPWNTFKWNYSATNEGGSEVPNDIRVGKFIMYSGAANRFLNSQEATVLATINGSANGNIINYSDYTELSNNIPVTAEEQQTLDAFRANYADWFKCAYQGGSIDAKDFTFQNSVKWDEFPWGTTGWNANIRMPFITVDNGDHYNTTFSPNGATDTYVIDRLVEITSVILNGAAADDAKYVIAQNHNEGSTSVTFDSILSVTDKLELVYEKHTRAFFEAADGASAQYTVPYRASVTETLVNGVSLVEGSGYSVTLQPTSTVIDVASLPALGEEVLIRHKRLHDVSVNGNGTTYLIHESDIIGEVSVNGVVTTDYVATEVGRDMQVVLNAAAVGVTVKISYSKRDNVFSNDTSLQTIDGGKFLPSNVDAGVSDEMAVYKASDGVVINYTDRSNAVSADDCRIFVSESGLQTLHSLYVNGTSGNKISLSAPLAYGDTKLTVSDATPFNNASVDSPSIVWLGSERLIYTGKSGNTLTGIRRMTAGTTLDVDGNSLSNVKDEYPIGSRVYPDSIMPILPSSVVPNHPHN